MKYICKVLGGSRAYGLDTPTSDIDYRGIFINTHPSTILGLDRFDSIQKQETDDEVYFELRKFFELLRNGNSGALEILFSADQQITATSPEFEIIRVNRKSFVDTDKTFKCLRGYMQGERRLANGERTGQLGGKRKVQLDAHGFSPKNATQLLRLAWCGVYLFKTGEFPVRIDYYDSKFSDMLLDIKTKPENYTKSQLNEMFDVAESMLVAEYDKRSANSKFDSDLATNILLKSYLPFLKLSFTTDETTLIERQFDVIH